MGGRHGWDGRHDRLGLHWTGMGRGTDTQVERDREVFTLDDIGSAYPIDDKLYLHIYSAHFAAVMFTIGASFIFFNLRPVYLGSFIANMAWMVTTVLSYRITDTTTALHCQNKPHHHFSRPHTTKSQQPPAYFFLVLHFHLHKSKQKPKAPPSSMHPTHIISHPILAHSQCISLASQNLHVLSFLSC